MAFTCFRTLTVAYLPAMVVASLPQLMSASQLYDQKDLGSDITSDATEYMLGVAVPVDPNLSMSKKHRPVQPTSSETTSFSRSDDESDFIDALSAPLLPGDGRSPTSDDAVYGGLASDSIGSSNYIYAAHDAAGTAARIVPPNLVASFPAFDVQGSLPGKFTDEFDSSGNSDNSNAPLTADGDWEAPWRASNVPASEFGSFSEDLAAGDVGNGGGRNGGDYGFDSGSNGYLGTLGDTGGKGGAGGTHPLDLTGTKGQKDGLLSAIASAAEPEGAGIAVVSLILIFVALHRRSNRRAGAARPS
jgi:hypothetical protein